jgi:hypothetical protein
MPASNGTSASLQLAHEHLGATVYKRTAPSVTGQLTEHVMAHAHLHFGIFMAANKHLDAVVM